jgi:drug/metabolite transporter (DMT)-like permease
VDYIYVIGTIVFTVYGQVAIKWRVSIYGNLPEPLLAKILFLLKMLYDPVILSGFFAAFLAALCWMAAMTKFELSHAYPFMALNFVLVLVLSGLFLNEPISSYKILGLIIIVVGIIVGSQG